MDRGAVGACSELSGSDEQRRARSKPWVSSRLSRCGFAEVDEAAERTLAVRCRRVEKGAGHVRCVRACGVDALPDRRCAVAAFQCELADERVGECVQDDEADAGPPLVFVVGQLAPRAPVAVGLVEALGSAPVAVALLALVEGADVKP
jgi:hypothetical protein